MSFDERVDVVDLILNILKEHEKNLDSLIDRLRETVQTKPGPNAPMDQVSGISRFQVTLRRWSEFSNLCRLADLIAFEVEGEVLLVSAVKDGKIYTYVEAIPQVIIRMEEGGERVIVEGRNSTSSHDQPNIFSGKLECGLGVRVRKSGVELQNGEKLRKICYYIDPEETRSWLSNELHVDKKSIIYGLIDREKNGK